MPTTLATPVSSATPPAPESGKGRSRTGWGYTLGRLFAVALLLLGLGPNPYGYYQFMRVVVTVVAAYSAYLCTEWDRPRWFWIFVTIAVLFNPIVPIHLGRSVWQPIDLLTAGVFIVSLVALRRSGHDCR